MLQRDLGRLVGSANGMPLYAPFCGSQRQAGRLVGYKGQQVLMPPGCPQFSGMTLGKMVGYANGMPLFAASECCVAGVGSGSFSGSQIGSSGGVGPTTYPCVVGGSCTGTTISGQPTITGITYSSTKPSFADTSGVIPGITTASGSPFSGSPTVLSVNSSTSVTMNANATASGTFTFSFSNLSLTLPATIYLGISGYVVSNNCPFPTPPYVAACPFLGTYPVAGGGGSTGLVWPGPLYNYSADNKCTCFGFVCRNDGVVGPVTITVTDPSGTCATYSVNNVPCGTSSGFVTGSTGSWIGATPPNQFTCDPFFATWTSITLPTGGFGCAVAMTCSG